MPPDEPAGPGRVRVLVHLRAEPADRPGLEAAYHRISQDLTGTPGLLGNELLRSTLDGGAFAVMSEWESLAAFTAWERGSAHRGTTAPLRPFHDRERAATFEILEVAAAYAGAGAAAAP